MTGLDLDSLQKVRDTIVELLSMRHNTRRIQKIKYRCKKLVSSNPNLARMCRYYLERKKAKMRSLNLWFDEEEGILLRLLTEMLELTKFT
jgi:glucuronate isomerase